MSYHLTTDWRNHRNQHLGKTPQNYNPMIHTIASYTTETKSEKMDTKSDLNEILHHSSYLTHLHMLPNPLHKNLADSLPEKTSKVPRKVYPANETNLHRLDSSNAKEMPRETFSTTFGTIGSFLSGVFNVITSAMPFQRRTKSPDRDPEFEFTHNGSPPLDFWLPAKTESQNKNNCRDQLNVQLCSNATYESAEGDMSSDCRSAVVNCEDKLNQVRMLLVSTPAPKPQPVVKRRRPKKLFVDPNQVEEGFEDAFTPEDFVRLSNEDVIECTSPCSHVCEAVVEAVAAKMKSEVAPLESMEIVTPVDVVKEDTKTAAAQIVVEGNSAGKNGIVTPEVLKKEVGAASIATENAVTESVKDICTDNATTRMLEAQGTVPKESTDIKTVSKQNEEVHAKDTDSNRGTEDAKAVIIQSCEDKVSRLKALLQERRRNNTRISHQSTDSVQESVEPSNEHNFTKNKPININKSHNKHYKNPNRQSNVDKRTKSDMRRNIADDMSFADELDLESSSVENSPKSKPCMNPESIKTEENYDDTIALPVSEEIITESPKSDHCYFNEVSGRFHTSSTTESEDSFQIVFTDSPQLSPRARRLSDCDSEDSFIIFEDVPGTCYTSADVFGHSSSETECSDYDTDDSEPNVPCKLSHSLSRTISDLTDDSLYSDNAVPAVKPYSDSEDEVDSSVTMAQQVGDSDIVKDVEIKSKGLLLDAAKKIARKNLPPKKVRFSTAPPKVLVMRVWSFAARQARAGHWERHAVDRERFKRKIADVDMAISWVLKPQHRNRVKFQRFMPWWHAERRRELAEKKEREAAEERTRIEEEQKRIAEEEERQRAEEENRLVALEEERKRVERERLKAEEKRLKEINRKRLLEQHMKSEEQRATEVSRRRAENERRRKEEEKYRIEAKQVAEELKKKMADEKKLLELEIARLEAEKVKLESGKVTESDNEKKEEVNVISDSNINVIVLDKGSEEFGNSLEVKSRDVREENVAIDQGNKGSDEVIAGKEGTQVEEENIKEEAPKVTLEEQRSCKTESTLSSTHQELSISESTVDEVTNVVTDNKESSANILDNLKVIRDNVGDKLDVPGDMIDKTFLSDMNPEPNTLNENPVSESSKITVDDCKDNLKLEALGNIDSSITAVPEINNIADTAEVFVDCVDKLIVNEDKDVFDTCNVMGQKREETIAKTSAESLENASTNQSFEQKTKLEERIVKEVANKELQMTEKECDNNVKINNTKTVKPALKKIQYIQNQFSPINVVKSKANKLNSQNVDKNVKNANYSKGLSAIAVNDNLNVEKHN